jgi:glycosyltransferase involved in cell wall biosynthesis
MLNLDRAREHQFLLYFNEAPEDDLFPWQPNVRSRHLPSRRLWTQLRLSWEMLRRRPDILFVPSHVLPVAHPRSVVTIHDLGYLYYPEAYRPFDLWYLKRFTALSAKWAQMILVDSEVTKEDVVEHLDVPEERVTVVHLAPSAEFTPHPEPGERERLAEIYGIDGEYILYVGTLHPRKNVARLVEAFALLRREAGIGERLVLAGAKGWLPQDLLEQVQEEEVRQAITLTGFLPPEDLPALIRQARLLVLPSLFEGFGLPVVEAFACRTAVVASNAGSLPEVAGDAAILVDPEDVLDIARGLYRVCTNEGLRERLRVLGLQRSAAFTWERSAEVALHALEQARR